MLHKLHDLKGFDLLGTDGKLGTIHDFYIDEDDWTVRWVVVDTGGWIMGRQVLLSPVSVETVLWDDKMVRVSLTKTQVEESPAISTDEPVSRQFETHYFDYFGWPYYWYGGYSWGGWAYPQAVASRGVSEAANNAKDTGDPHLRSANEVKGYQVHPGDGQMGNVEDFVIDDETWGIRYLLVDTADWWFGKHVLVGPSWISKVDWRERRVDVALTS